MFLHTFYTVPGILDCKEVLINSTMYWIEGLQHIAVHTVMLSSIKTLINSIMHGVEAFSLYCCTCFHVRFITSDSAQLVQLIQTKIMTHKSNSIGASPALTLIFSCGDACVYLFVNVNTAIVCEAPCKLLCSGRRKQRFICMC